MIFFRLFTESFLFAWNALINNKLRTFLSLTGVTIGILAIISVFTIVDSLEKNVRQSVSKLGSNVIYLQKWSWGAPDGEEYKWWEFMKRPEMKLSELDKLQSKLKKSDASAFIISSNRTVKYQNNSVQNTEVFGISYEWNQIRNFDLEIGRYFTQGEVKSGKNNVIVGYDIANAFFPVNQSIGKTIKINGNKCVVIGVFKKEGQDITGNSLDQSVVVPISFGQKFISKRSNPMILVKASPSTSNIELKDEIRGVMRSIRKLKPQMKDNFSMNEISLISNQLDSLFSVIGLAGWVIGGFSILVGGFGIANIMFVSVKERTKLIGIQKALGAKNSFILFQFLLESIFLCFAGGALGLFMVYLLSQAITNFTDFVVELTLQNILLGIIVSVVIGIISGITPALSASKLDPVEAIRR
ncbi:MAG: ABC transporter permease [Flavobacteriales bacterium]